MQFIRQGVRFPSRAMMIYFYSWWTAFTSKWWRSIRVIVFVSWRMDSRKMFPWQIHSGQFAVIRWCGNCQLCKGSMKWCPFRAACELICTGLSANSRSKAMWIRINMLPSTSVLVASNVSLIFCISQNLLLNFVNIKNTLPCVNGSKKKNFVPESKSGKGFWKYSRFSFLWF